MRSSLFKFIFFCISILPSIHASSQSTKIEIREPNLTKLLDAFIKNTLSKYDSLKINDRALGIVSIELYSVDKSFFPIGNAPKEMTPDSLSNGSKMINLRISMILSKDFFEVFMPSLYSIYKDRPIVFFTGLERLGAAVNYNRAILKKFEKNLHPFYGWTFSWLVQIDEEGNNFQILEKVIF